MNPLYDIEDHFPAFRKDLADKVPEHLRGGLARYVIHGIKPGSFLTAAIGNDLHGAIRYGDDDSIDGMKATITFLYNSTPIGCFGSPEHVKEWIKSGGLQGILKESA